MSTDIKFERLESQATPQKKSACTSWVKTILYLFIVVLYVIRTIAQATGHSVNYGTKDHELKL